MVITKELFSSPGQRQLFIGAYWLWILSEIIRLLVRRPRREAVRFRADRGSGLSSSSASLSPWGWHSANGPAAWVSYRRRPSTPGSS